MNKTPYWKSPVVLAGALLPLAVFAVYIRTLAPGLSFIDSGELAAVACTLGIAHPTGYPLFTLVGWLFSRLPIPGEEIYRLNVMAAFFSAAGVFAFFRLALFLLGGNARPPRGTAFRHPVVPAIFASLVLAFSPTWWMQATSVEVYSLHIVFLPTLVLLFLRALETDRSEIREAAPRWMLFALVLGLSFTNHMTTILLSVGLLYLYLPSRSPGSAVPSFRMTRSDVRLLGMMTLPFLLGLSLYLYLPVRGSQDPVFSWGDPVTLERFLRHVGGKQYSVWIFSSAETAWRQLGYFAGRLGAETTWVGLAAAAIGLPAMFRRDRRVGTATVLLFVTCVGYAVNYDIHDIDSYFLLAYMVIALWAAFGFRQAILWTDSLSRPAVPLLLLSACSLLPLALNFSDRNESGNYLVEDYTTNMFRSFQPDALVLSFQWDFWVSASYYVQVVESVRPDVVVVDKELLRRSWYLKELGRRYPWLIGRSKKEVDQFSVELEKFEQDLPYDPALIQARFVAMVRSFLLRNTDRPLYVTAEMEPEFTTGFGRVPEGLAIRLIPPGGTAEARMPELQFRPFVREGRLENRLLQLYSEALKGHGLYHYSQNRLSEARKHWAAALRFNPSAVDVRQWLEQTGGPAHPIDN